MIYRLLAAMMAALALSSAAKADIEMCNNTSRRMSIAIAGYVTIPYSTWEAKGWYNLNPRTCTQVMYGSQAGADFFYAAWFPDTRENWVEDATYFPICVRQDGQGFVRRGSPRELQQCPPGGILLNFYKSYSASRNRRITLNGY